MQDNCELLMSFGLTRQEARIYILLLTEGVLSGYEAAKRIGISRSNAYGSLAGLVEKGAVYVAEEQSVRYQAVPLKEFCSNKLHRMEEISDILRQQIPKEMKQSDNYITIRGRRHVEDKICNMLHEAEERIYLSASEEVIGNLKKELEALIKEKKKVVLLTQKTFLLEGASIYHVAAKSGQLRLITDSSFALVGEMQDEVHTTCLYSSNPNLVQLLKETLANEIQLIQIAEEKRKKKEAK